MTSKKSFFYKLSAILAAASLCLTKFPITAAATEQGREYEVTGRMTADGPLFNGENSIEVKNGYYSMNLASKWNYFTCESADGSLKIEYYIEKDDIYRFVITNQGEFRGYREDIITYQTPNKGIMDENTLPQGLVFDMNGYNLDFTGLTFAAPQERYPAGIYEAVGFNTVNADYVQVRLYGAVIDIHFFKNGELVRNLAANYHAVNAEGTVSYADDYQGIFKASVTNEGKVYGSFVSSEGEKPIEFDMQMKEPATIKSGTYSSKGNFAEGIDEIRISTVNMDYTFTLLNQGNVVKFYELALLDAKQDGPIVLGAYDGSNLQSEFRISSDGTITGTLYAGYNINLNTTLTDLNTVN